MKELTNEEMKDAMTALSEKAMEIANAAAEETKRLLKEIDDYGSAHPFDDLQDPDPNEPDLQKYNDEWSETVAEWMKPVEALFDKMVVPAETLRELTDKFKNVGDEYSHLVQLVDDYVEDWGTNPTYDR